MILIPAGDFLMGSDPAKDKHAQDDEQPQHTLHLPDYYIAKTPVTNAQYATFVQATGHRSPKHWKHNEPPHGKQDHSVVYVSWHDAIAFCDWLSELTARPYRLPSEAGWEKAARGTDGRIYPWGDDWDPQRCNFGKGWSALLILFNSDTITTTPVGDYSPRGDSPYSLLDMAGNVWEWTRSLWGGKQERTDFRYPYDPGDGREHLDAPGYRVVRGGAFYASPRRVRCAYRLWHNRFSRGWDLGFRACAVSQQN